jgi:hypothetical protein
LDTNPYYSLRGSERFKDQSIKAAIYVGGQGYSINFPIGSRMRRKSWNEDGLVTGVK